MKTDQIIHITEDSRLELIKLQKRIEFNAKLIQSGSTMPTERVKTILTLINQSIHLLNGYK